MRLKQSNKLNNKLYLPPLKRIQSNQISPKNQYSNHSLPKILPNDLSQIQSHLIVNENKGLPKKRKATQDRMKAMNNKRKDYSQFSTIEQKHTPQTIDDASITKGFQQEIQRNLQQIKKSKESYRNKTNKKIPLRYQEPIKYNLFQEEREESQQKLRLQTHQSVFSKIHSIIASPNNYTVQTDSYLSFNSAHPYPKIAQSIYNRHLRKKIKTQATQGQFEQIIQKSPIKHNDNFQEWRKLSIESLSDDKVKYEESSYDIESERVQMIRNRNQVSMSKYLLGKEYLDKLITYRQSAMTLAKKQ